MPELTQNQRVEIASHVRRSDYYKSQLIETVSRYWHEGATVRELAHVAGVSERTMSRWLAPVREWGYVPPAATELEPSDPEPVPVTPVTDPLTHLARLRDVSDAREAEMRDVARYAVATGETVAAVARYAGVSRATVYGWIRAAKPTVIKTLPN